MIKIIGNISIGKTAKLIERTVSSNGILVCKDINRMWQKVYSLGYGREIELETYERYIKYLKTKDPDLRFNIDNKKIFIDDISCFMIHLDNNISGYTDTIEIKTDYR